MIAKRVPSKKGGGSFKKLAAYILRENSNKTIASSQINNCHFDESDLAIKEINATQARNTRSNNDKNYHLIVSFREGEQPDSEQLKDIEETFCQAIGYEGHQRISAVHDDTDNLHLHIAINKINPISFNAIEPYYDKYELDKVCEALEIKHDLQKDNRIDKNPLRERNNPQVKTLEAHQGIESFSSYLKEHKDGIQSCLEKAENWQDLQQGLAAYDIHLKKRGAGLVFASQSDQYHCPASQIDRQFSKKSLEDQLGAYQARNETEQKKPPKKSYKALPKKDYQIGEKDTLWQSFKKAQHERSGSLKQLQAEKREAFADLKSAYAKERLSIKNHSGLKGKEKRAVYDTVFKAYQQQQAELKRTFAEKGQQFNQQYPYKNWQDYLIHQSSQGNGEALKRLRQASRYKKPASRFAFLSQSEAPDQQVFTALAPTVNKRGEVEYQLPDVTVTDTGEHLDVKSDSHRGLVAGIRLAQKKYGKTLSIKGDDAFKKAVLEVVIQENIPVQFTDPDLEKTRRALLTIKDRQQDKTPEGVDDSKTSAVQNWIDQRNETRYRVQDLAEHQLFKSSDAGNVHYQGVRKIGKGNEKVALYAKGDKMLVKPLSEPQAKHLKQYSIGQALRIERSGHVKAVTRDKGIER